MAAKAECKIEETACRRLGRRGNQDDRGCRSGQHGIGPCTCVCNLKKQSQFGERQNGCKHGRRQALWKYASASGAKNKANCRALPGNAQHQALNPKQGNLKKQSQFAGRRNERKLIHYKGIQQPCLILRGKKQSQFPDGCDSAAGFCAGLSGRFL